MKQSRRKRSPAYHLANGYVQRAGARMPSSARSACVELANEAIRTPSSSRRKSDLAAPREQPAHDWLVFDHVTLRWSERLVFPHTSWRWRRGEQWALVGPNGSGKSLLALALIEQVPVVRGEIRYCLDDGEAGEPISESSVERIALVSPHAQRELMIQESSFYQSRWHSGIDEGQRTVAQFLAQASVERINPFEVRQRPANARRFQTQRRLFLRELDIAHLWRRKIIHLSNGELRKVLLVEALLRFPRLLILDDPYAGLDRASRDELRKVIRRLMQQGLPVLIITNRIDELPPATTHLLVADRYRIIAQGPRGTVHTHPVLLRAAAPIKASPSAARPSPRLTGRKTVTRSAPVVELNHVTIEAGRKRILDDVTWRMRRGEHWALLGANGAGKTTLLNLLQGDHPQAYAQDIRLFGGKSDSTQTVWQWRQQMGWVSPELHLHYPVEWQNLEVVCSGFFNTLGLFQRCSRHQQAIARHWLDELGVANLADESFGELSAGQQRLVLLARAVVKQPRLLILDELCQGLDRGHRQAVLSAVDHLVQRAGASLIFVTHHPDEMPQCITHVLELKAGRIVTTGGEVVLSQVVGSRPF